MRTINIPKRGNDTTIMVIAPVGSRFEDQKLKGISHFLEHMAFKGTPTRTTKDITYGIERYGGYLNAFTGKEVTWYIARIANRYKNQALNILKDMAKNPVISQKEVDKERQVILEELKMYEDNSEDSITDLVNRYIYKRSSGLYLDEGGTPRTLARINRKELLKHHQNNYNDLILIQVGDIKERRDSVSWRATAPEKINLKNMNKKFLIEKNDIKQANMTISNYIYLDGMTSLEKEYSFRLIYSIMSDMSGRLFRVIRDRYNLVYNIQMYFNQYTCGGVQWWIALGLKKSNMSKAYSLIMRELTRPFSKKEIEYGIKKLSGEIALYLESSRYVAKEVCKNLSLGIDCNEDLYNCEKNLRKASKNIREVQKKIDFDNNILLGIVPK